MRSARFALLADMTPMGLSTPGAPRATLHCSVEPCTPIRLRRAHPRGHRQLHRRPIRRTESSGPLSVATAYVLTQVGGAISVPKNTCSVPRSSGAVAQHPSEVHWLSLSSPTFHMDGVPGRGPISQPATHGFPWQGVALPASRLRRCAAPIAGSKTQCSCASDADSRACDRGTVDRRGDRRRSLARLFRSPSCRTSRLWISSSQEP